MLRYRFHHGSAARDQILGRLLALLVSLGLAACTATAPPAPQPGPALPRLERSHRICGESARALVFENLGVPRSEKARDVALGESESWVLFAPARVVRIDRGVTQPRVTMFVGTPEDSWSALDLDPLDGSLWLATDPFGLKRIHPNGHVETLRLTGVVGEGQIARLMVARDAVYVQPVLAAYGLLRFDRQGKLLAAQFPAPEEEEKEEPSSFEKLTSGWLRLERDQGGSLLVWDRHARKLFRLEGDGAWVETDPALFARLPAGGSVTGLNVGGREEAWYFPGTSSLFFWQGEPMFLGSRTVGARVGSDTVLLHRDGESWRESIEECAGVSLIAVRSDSRSYVALTPVALVIGSFPAP